MQISVETTYRNIDPTPALERAILKRAATLERFHDRIVSCRVTLDAPHRHNKKGNLCEVRVEVVVPGGAIVVEKHPVGRDENENVYVSLRDAFRAVRRRLQDFARVQRGMVKARQAA